MSNIAKISKVVKSLWLAGCLNLMILSLYKYFSNRQENSEFLLLASIWTISFVLVAYSLIEEFIVERGFSREKAFEKAAKYIRQEHGETVGHQEGYYTFYEHSNSHSLDIYFGETAYVCNVNNRTGEVEIVRITKR
ncbi:MAG: hypothetical protein ACOZAO_00700 [Patescibacteria group bacterium]